MVLAEFYAASLPVSALDISIVYQLSSTLFSTAFPNVVGMDPRG